MNTKIMIRLSMVVSDGEVTITKTPFSIIKETLNSYRVQHKEADTFRIVKKASLNSVNASVYPQTSSVYSKRFWVLSENEEMMDALISSFIDSARVFFTKVSKEAQVNLLSLSSFKK